MATEIGADPEKEEREEEKNNNNKSKQKNKPTNKQTNKHKMASSCSPNRPPTDIIFLFPSCILNLGKAGAYLSYSVR